MKEPLYFKHDYGSRNDPKLQLLLSAHGAAGMGVFWCLVEQLYEQDGKLPMTMCKSVGFSLHVKPSMVASVIKDFGLFDYDEESFWSKTVLSRLGRRKDVKTKRSESAVKRWEKDKDTPENPDLMQNECKIEECDEFAEQMQCKSNANAMQKQCKSNANAMQKQCKSNANAMQKQGREREREKEILPVGSTKKNGERFSPPTLEEVRAYIDSKGYGVDAEKWYHFYNSKGWMVGSNKMKNWHSAIATWQRDEQERVKHPEYKPGGIPKNCNDEWT